MKGWAEVFSQVFRSEPTAVADACPELQTTIVDVSTIAQSEPLRVRTLTKFPDSGNIVVRRQKAFSSHLHCEVWKTC